MKFDEFIWLKLTCLSSLCSIILLIRFIPSVDTYRSSDTFFSRQTCAKIQSTLSFGKYKTFEISSNVNYISHLHSQNFLAYSPPHDLLIFIEPKQQLHVYNAQTIRLIVNITTTDVIFVTSCTTLKNSDYRDLFFIYELYSESNILLLKICEMNFNKIRLNFEEKNCIHTLKMSSTRKDIRITGFAIKRNHAGTDKSILFISSSIGLIYTIFNTYSGELINEPVILNDTSNEGNVAITSSSIVYYANKQENTIHELRITQDFRIRYGKIIKSNAIKAPFGLMVDECDHLYIATKSMILIMAAQKYITIRTVSSKASYLPITLERLNSTTYVYTAVKTNSGKSPFQWMFNFVSFIDPEKPLVTSRRPVVNTDSPWIRNYNKYTYFSTTRTKTMLDDYDTSSSSSSLSSSDTMTPSETIGYTSENLDSFNSITTSSSTPEKTEKNINSYTTSMANVTELTDSSGESSQYSASNFTFSLVTQQSTNNEDYDSQNTYTQETLKSYEEESTVSELLRSDNSIPPYLDSSTMISINESVSWIDNSSNTISLNNNTSDNLNDLFHESTQQSIMETENFTLLATVTDFVQEELKTEIDQNYSSSILIDVTNATTLYSPPPPPLIISSSTSISTTVSSLLSPSHHSQSRSSTKSTKVNRLSSSNKFLTTPTRTASLQTSDVVSGLDTVEKNVTANFSEETSSPSSTINDNRFTYKLETISYEPLLTSNTILESSPIDSTTLTTTHMISTNIVSAIIITTDEPSTIPITISTNEENHSLIYSEIFETNTPSSTMNEYSTSVETYSPIEPTQLITKRTRKLPSTRSIIDSTKRRNLYRTRKRKISRFKSPTSTSTTTTDISSIQTTTIQNIIRISTPFSIIYSNLTFPQQPIIIIKPSLTTNASNVLLSKQLFNELLNSTTNSSNEKIIHLDLIDLPPSSWNLSLNTSESVALDIVLPASSHSSTNSNTTTNLTITDINANHLSTNIIGSSINLQVDKIQTKKFSLSMNQKSNDLNHVLSNVIIGRIKTEEFELNLTKSDNLNVNIQQIDSATADIYLNSDFCTNENNLQINLNLSQHGTIRYGNQTPIHIGPVFTRLNMPKNSCDLDQPLKFFFDICQSENPCLNGGICNSIIPDYENESIPTESTEIRYQCTCPSDILGEHCQFLQEPLVFCTNGGTLIEIIGINNKTHQECLCPEGFQGDFCEDNIDDCKNIRCSYHGLCQDDKNSYRCLCFDGYYGNECEEKNVQTVLLQIASKSFAIVAILVIMSIVFLVIASDIHTYVITKEQIKQNRLNRIRSIASEVIENSGRFRDLSMGPIEMSAMLNRDTTRKLSNLKYCSSDTRKSSGYRQLSMGKYIKTLRKPLSSKHYIFIEPTYETVL